MPIVLVRESISFVHIHTIGSLARSGYYEKMFSMSRRMPVMFELFLLAAFLGAVLASNGRSYDPARSTLVNAFAESNIPYYGTTSALPTFPAFKTDSNGSNFDAPNVLPIFPTHGTGYARIDDNRYDNIHGGAYGQKFGSNGVDLNGAKGGGSYGPQRGGSGRYEAQHYNPMGGRLDRSSTLQSGGAIGHFKQIYSQFVDYLLEICKQNPASNTAVYKTIMQLFSSNTNFNPNQHFQRQSHTFQRNELELFHCLQSAGRNQNTAPTNGNIQHSQMFSQFPSNPFGPTNNVQYNPNTRNVVQNIYQNINYVNNYHNNIKVESNPNMRSNKPKMRPIKRPDTSNPFKQTQIFEERNIYQNINMNNFPANSPQNIPKFKTNSTPGDLNFPTFPNPMKVDNSSLSKSNHFIKSHIRTTNVPKNTKSVGTNTNSSPTIPHRNPPVPIIITIPRNMNTNTENNNGNHNLRQPNPSCPSENSSNTHLVTIFEQFLNSLQNEVPSKILQRMSKISKKLNRKIRNQNMRNTVNNRLDSRNTTKIIVQNSLKTRKPIQNINKKKQILTASTKSNMPLGNMPPTKHSNTRTVADKNYVTTDTFNRTTRKFNNRQYKRKKKKYENHTEGKPYTPTKS
eukprot:555757_1